MLYPVLLAAVLLLAVRFLLFMHVRLPERYETKHLPAGSHVAVFLPSYGLRLPGEDLWGYHRCGAVQPEEGDLMLCRFQGSNEFFLAVCRSLPLDTLWVDVVRKKILPGKTSPDAQAVAIPKRHCPMPVRPCNARIYAFLLRSFEHSMAEVSKDGTLVCNGRSLKTVRFTTDYYWVETQPDSFLLIPHEALVGKAFPIKMPLP